MTTIKSDPAAADGGQTYLSWSLSPDSLEKHETDLLQALGAALLTRWFELPRDVQESLFNAASATPHNADDLRVSLARFLHDHAK
ncbi:hypothetical protein [Asticcacaulis taihuensis]|jgi:hypothetical protein|uniref:hypothetical protein n=1 Tax=Asticcacaulis taihuensis TaxID=260084 RepID=UPI0026EFEFC1|nr:hypothetical protein [Asticcacaulis taihuensis]